MKFYRETEFQETEIGKMPKDWKITKLGSVVKYVKGKKPSSLFDERPSEEYIPYLTAEYMRGLDKPKWCNPKLENNIVEVSRDDVLMIWDGSYAGHVFTGFNGILASTMVRITPIVELDKKFLYYHLLANFEKIRSTTVGTGIPHVNKKVFEEFLIPIPPLAEQQKIAEILSSVDKTIEDGDNAITRLERLKKTLMGELLTGRIRVKEVDGKLTFYRETEFQETEIGKMPKDWKIKKLGELLEFAHGKRPGMLLTNGGIPIYGAGGFYGYTNTYLVNNPAILVIARVGKGSVGKVYLVRGSVWITDNAIYGYSKDPSGLTATYAYHWLIFDKNWVEKYVRRSAGGYAIITLDSLENLKIPIPTISEQANIVNVIYLFTKVIELHHEEKRRLERLKRGLMHMLLTGKIRVRES
jgi:type I restriction enzyme S subunit